MNMVLGVDHRANDGAGGVDECVGAREPVGQPADIGQVVDDELSPEIGEVLGAAGIADERHHLIAALTKLSNDSVPNEPGAAGDDDPAWRQLSRWTFRDQQTRATP
jgi:hypothetical protein